MHDPHVLTTLSQDKKDSLLEELLSKTVENHMGCWLWTKSCFPSGYGQRMVKSTNFTVHRLIYKLLYGELTKEVVVRHLCGNRRCCNPLHLESGSRKDNSQDSVVHGTSYFHVIDQNGSNNHMAKLDEQTVYALRIKYGAGGYTFDQLGEIFNVSRKAVERAVRGKTYQDFNDVPPIKSTRRY